jgi:transcription elongation factor GreB
MSKAFTKDDAPPVEGEDVGEAEGRATRGSPYITPAGHRRLAGELEQLWRVERPRITAEVAAAAAQGDRSENAEYIYGKKKLREIDRRIRFLSKRLDVVQVVEPSKEQEGKVFFGAWVTIEDDDEKRSTFRIVGTDEPDSTIGYISVESPVARALLGRSVGDVVVIHRPKGPTEVTVIAIRYTEPEASLPSR